MKTVQSKEITGADLSTLLVDVSSINRVAAYGTDGLLTKPSVAPKVERLLNCGDPDIVGLLEVLSNVVCFERLLVDKRGFYAFYRANELEESLRRTGLLDFFNAVVFPEQAYFSAADQVTELRKAIREHAPKKLIKEEGPYLENLFGYEETKDVDDETLKDMFDGRCELENPDFRPQHMPVQIAETGMSVERLFVYLEVARHLEVPVTVARGKYKALEEVGSKARAIASAIRAQVERQERGTRSGLNEVEEQVQRKALPGITLSAPLLPTHIVRVARERQWSLMDATKYIREDPAASEFRKYLWANRKAFDPITAGDHLRAKEITEELAKLGKRIADAKSSSGVFRYSNEVTINVSNIPCLGVLLKMINVRKLDIPIYMTRNPPTYEVFIARWFTK